MATKYEPEKDYTRFRELAKEREELEKAIAELLEETSKLKTRIEEHLAAAREKVDTELIQAAAHEFQVEILNEITKAVMESGDLEKAVRLIDRLETHLAARLRLSAKEKEEVSRETAPSVLSPAIAARKHTPPQAGLQRAAPLPPMGSLQVGGRIIERRTVVEDKVNEICRYEYDGERLSRLVFLDPYGHPLRTHQLIYTREGLLTQEIHVDRAGVTLLVFDREVEKDGRILREVVRNAQNVILNTVEFTHDRKGKLVKKEWKDSRGRKIKSWEYRYEKDVEGPSKIVWRDEHNKAYGFVDLRYDDKSHILEETTKDITGDLIRVVTYQYFYG